MHPQVITYNAALRAHIDGSWEGALSLLHGMPAAQISPDVISHNTVPGRNIYVLLLRAL